MSYYNTTGETNPQLEVFHKKATGQDNIISELFAENPLKTYTPSEVWQLLMERGSIHANTPLTSIRRAMNTLTRDDVLVKLEWKTKSGPYGRPEHCWTKANI